MLLGNRAHHLVNLYPSGRLDGSMRVLFLTNLWPDHARPHWGTFVRSQAESLLAAGISIDTLAIRGYASPAAYLKAIPATVARLRNADYDLVHVHTGHVAAISSWWIPLPVVVSFIGGDLLGEPRIWGKTIKSQLEVAAFRQVARTATATITKSEEMANALPSAVRKKNTVIPNGVDLDAFAPIPKSEARAILGWRPEERVVLFLGNPADPRKNVTLTRLAVERARAAIPTLRIQEAFGTPPERIPLLMSAADCLSLSSRSEGSPNVVKEAMAAALPVVATPVGDVPQRLAGVDGCYVVTGEVSDFADGIIEAVRAGRAPAAQAAISGLSLDAVAAQVIDVYHRATEDKRCRSAAHDQRRGGYPC